MDDPAPATPATNQQEVLVWNPAFGAVAWLGRWGLWSIFVAVVCESFITGLWPSLHLGSIAARAMTIFVGVGLSLLGLDFVQSLFQRMGRGAIEAPTWRTGLHKLAVVSAVAFLCAWGVISVLRSLYTALGGLRAAAVEPSTAKLDNALGAIAALVLVVALWFHGSITLRTHRRVLRTYGLRYLTKGYFLMALIRLRQNRRDFFEQAPVVSNMRGLAFAAAAHDFAANEVLSWVLPVLIVLFSIEWTAAQLCPPVWLFLGRSNFAAYHLFTTLRHAWREEGVNLLDRSSEEWHVYYQHWRTSWIRAGSRLAPFINSPGISRDWSLRPRGDLWQPTAWNLMGLVPAIILDGREASRHIDDEILWVVEMDHIDKVWLIAADDGAVPALQSAFDWASADNVQLAPGSAALLAARVVVASQLEAAHWVNGRLAVPPRTDVPPGS